MCSPNRIEYSTNCEFEHDCSDSILKLDLNFRKETQRNLSFISETGTLNSIPSIGSDEAPSPDIILNNINKDKEKDFITEMKLPPGKLVNNIRGLKGKGISIAHLNINFIYHKFEALKSFVWDNVDILVISETKLDDSYPINEFLIDGFLHILEKINIAMMEA